MSSGTSRQGQKRASVCKGYSNDPDRQEIIDRLPNKNGTIQTAGTGNRLEPLEWKSRAPVEDDKKEIDIKRSEREEDEGARRSPTPNLPARGCSRNIEEEELKVEEKKEMVVEPRRAGKALSVLTAQSYH